MNVQIDISTKPESGDGKNPKLEVHFYALAHHKLRLNSLICSIQPNTQPRTIRGDFQVGNPGGVQSCGTQEDSRP
jgi:hypothetical protein